MGNFSNIFAQTLSKTSSVKGEIKTQFLWNKGSANNGVDSAKRPGIELFIPYTPGNIKRAAILILPGGAYRGLAKHEGAPVAELFASKGIVSAVLTYRVAPNTFPAPYADAARAIRLLRSMAKELNIDVNKIGIMGFSAGGHLASTIATQPELYKDPEDLLGETISSKPDRLILAYPVISFSEFAHLGSVKNLLGEKPDLKMILHLSNNLQVNASTPPTFLFHTADDPGVSVQNSILFAQACLSKNVPVALHIYPKGKHGVGLAVNELALKEWPGVLLKWLDDWQFTPLNVKNF
ncbi:MAG TPA: alpha/beta hydrolase [Sphingobacteriaceae bacterium]|nr:alpha/beta hydrolase [Sphingobacteriaceae bacterium]